MNFWTKYLMGQMLLMDKAGEGDGGGGSGGDPGDKGGKGEGDGGDPGDKGGSGQKTVTMTQDQFDKLMAKIDGKQSGGDGGDDGDLLDKHKKAQADKDKHNNDAKSLESAIRFSMGAKEWIKDNESLLPEDVAGILAAADKETYDSPIQKDAAIKSGIIQAFFNVQENLDLLTASQKQNIESWLKLTKNGKEEKAQSMYDQVFEPTFQMLKRIKKAEQLNRAGERNSTDSEEAYRDKLVKLSKQHYMGVKPDA